MAYEFQYRVELSILHPAARAEAISRRLDPLVPTFAISAGEPRKAGPRAGRLASRTVWSCYLHDLPVLDSGTHDLNAFLHGLPGRLNKHSDYFAELNSAGDAYLQLQWFTESTHSVCVLQPETLKGISGLNLPLAIEHYCYAFRSEEAQ